MNNINKSLKTSNGITLIALVITIIVLLILAGISISMLSGDNGILQKTTTAKENTEKASVIEQAKTEILGQIAENKGETITETQLKAILGIYFEDFNDELPEDLSEATITLTAKNEYGGYTNIALADIYNGKIVKAVTHTYHLDCPDRMSPIGKAHIYLYDENNNTVPIKEEYIVSINSSDYTMEEGCIVLSRRSTPPYNYEFVLNVDGQEVSETFFIPAP